jgi:hypothetical protein
MIINLFTAIIFGVILWGMIYGLFASNSKSTISFIAFLIVLFCFPQLQKKAARLHDDISQSIFEKNATGKISLSESPLKAPEKDSQRADYCKQFTYQNGDPVKVIMVLHHGAFCGNSIYYENEAFLVPYKLLPNGKAEYWTSSDYIYIGPAPVNSGT